MITSGVNPGFLTDETINLSGGAGGLAQGVAQLAFSKYRRKIWKGCIF
ncbi:MAG: hypothetical protein CM15mV20_2840 [uncultured marine virus]|nr:MAG: hypothetical protein CM15mV20_2840 [uncultured marine virus]